MQIDVTLDVIVISDQLSQGRTVTVEGPAIWAHKRQHTARAEELEATFDEGHVEIGPIIN